ncbi:MAG: class I tRNA ligase family protein, partial [Clostridia bacterium]|nr:class I tRNA ligase family protein [Clostridia bacterium]
IEKYVADALRFTLATGNSPGNDMRYLPERVEASRNFANKIWNAARFILMNLDENEPAPYIPENLAVEDKWIISKFNTLAKEVTDNLEKFELGLAVQKLYDFIWDVFCDWYIEIAKIRLNGEYSKTAKAVLVYVMSGCMKLLHPFMPFITEEIWQSLPHDGESIMISDWVEYDEKLNFECEEEQFESIMSAVKAIRTRRSEMNVAPSKKAAIYIATEKQDIFETSSAVIAKLASGSEVQVAKEFAIENAVSIVTNDATIYIPLGELVDFEAERARLNKEKEAIVKKLELTERKLSNEGFLAKAPANVVESEKEKAVEMKSQIALIDEQLAKL